MMRIALVSEYYYPTLGGISEHVHFLAHGLSTLGHRVHVVCPRTGSSADARDDTNVTIHRIGCGIPYYSNGSFARVTWGWNLTRQMQELFDRERFDVIHVQSPTVPVLPVLAQVAGDAVMVGTSHTEHGRHIFYDLFRPFLQRYLDSFDGLIGVSPICAESMHRYFRADYRIIPNGIDIDMFSSGKPLPQFSDGKKNILFLARLEPRNGLDMLIPAFALVQRRHTNTRLIVVGDSPLRSYYQAIARRSGASDICFVGKVGDGRPDYYASSHVFCFPVQKASFGITMLESMAARVPIVAADLPAFRALVENGIDALLADQESPEALAGALCWMLENEAGARAMAERSFVKVQRYAWSNVAAEVAAYYEELLARRKSGAVQVVHNDPRACAAQVL